MKPRDAGILTIVIGVLALQVSASNAILKYLRPSMRPYLLSTAVLLIAAGVVSLLTLRAKVRGDAAGPGADEDPEIGSAELHSGMHHRPSRMGWMLLLPALIAVVVAPGTFGSWGAGRHGALALSYRHDFDLGKYLAAQRLAGSQPSMKISDFLWAASDPEQTGALATVDVEITGFVTHVSSDGEGVVRVNRYVMGCCAADASPLQVIVRGSESLADDQWVKMKVRYVPAWNSGATERDEVPRPVVQARGVRKIATPAQPFEYLY